MRKECTLEWVDDNGNVISNGITPIKAESSEETVSKAKVLALINKAMFSIDNRDMQDYIFHGLRRDVHNLPSSDRPKGEWIEVTNGRGGHECSNCHAYAPSYMSGDEHLSDFCPNCGCQMIGGDTE